VQASSGGIKVLIRATSAPVNPKPAPSSSDCSHANADPLRRLSVASWGSASYADVLMTRGPSAVMAAVPEELVGAEGGGCLGANAGEGGGTGEHATGGATAHAETEGAVGDGKVSLGRPGGPRVLVRRTPTYRRALSGSFWCAASQHNGQQTVSFDLVQELVTLAVPFTD
jgi:hypothetical protein